jgi:hypothetical protein
MMKPGWVILIVILVVIMACLAWFLYATPDFVNGMFPPDAAIKTGTYARTDYNITTPQPVAVTVVRMDIDRKKGLAVFHLQDGSTVQAALAGPDQVKWSEGCPSMVADTRMEFVPLAEDRLVLGETAFEKPYLAGICPAPPLKIVLCDSFNAAKCVYFESK